MNPARRSRNRMNGRERTQRTQRVLNERRFSLRSLRSFAAKKFAPPAQTFVDSSTRFFPDSAGKKRFARGEQPATGMEQSGRRMEADEWELNPIRIRLPPFVCFPWLALRPTCWFYSVDRCTTTTLARPSAYSVHRNQRRPSDVLPVFPPGSLRSPAERSGPRTAQPYLEGCGRRDALFLLALGLDCG